MSFISPSPAYHSNIAPVISSPVISPVISFLSDVTERKKNINVDTARYVQSGKYFPWVMARVEITGD